MESPLKQRLIGAAVLAALAIIFLPMLLKGPDLREPDAAEVPLSMPQAPGESFETRELPLTAPEPPGAGSVLGMAPSKPAPAASAEPDEVVPEDAVAQAEPAPPAAPAAKPEPAAATPKPAAAEAPAPAPVAQKPATPATAAGAYALTVGSFANAASASDLAARLRSAGLPVVSDRVTLSSGPATRLRVGPFASRTAAEAVRQRVEQISGSPSRAFVLDAPAPAPSPASTTAPVPAPAKPKPSAEAAVASGFAVQLSAPSVEADAMALRDKARAAGFDSFVRRVDTDDGARYRVRVGPVADRAQAVALQGEAKSKLGIDGIVVSNP